MKRLLAVTAVALLLFLPSVVAAVGPHDGAYVVTATGSNGVTLTYYIVVIESAETFGFAGLYPDGAWDYGLGQKTSPNSGAGTLYRDDGEPYGSFSASIGEDGVLRATSVLVTGVTFQLVGVRFL